MIAYVGLLKTKKGKRDEYIQKLLKSEMINIFRKQDGNVYYEIAKSETDEDMVVVTDGWVDMNAFILHDTCNTVKEIWKPLEREYVVAMKGYILKE